MDKVKQVIQDHEDYSNGYEADAVLWDAFKRWAAAEAAEADTLSDKTCADCPFFELDRMMPENGNGTCRVRPPHAQYGFPEVSGDEWCGIVRGLATGEGPIPRIIQRPTSKA